MEQYNIHQLDNLKAKDKFLDGKGDNLEKAMHDSPSESINYLRLLGLSCSNCGGFVSDKNLSYFNHNILAVKCYDCQYGKDK